ncbi:MAG: hypothetical protein ACXWQX_15990 [Bdellovibrio sp.]
MRLILMVLSISWLWEVVFANQLVPFGFFRAASVQGRCNNSIAIGCIVGSHFNDNGQTSCGTTRTWYCSGQNGGANSGQCSYSNAGCPIAGSCNNGTPLGCSTGSYFSDNGQTSCGTTRTWYCSGQNGGANSGQCSYSYAACPIAGSCNNGTPLGCATGSYFSDNGQTSCGTSRTWYCSGQNGGASSGQCSYSNPACCVPTCGYRVRWLDQPNCNGNVTSDITYSHWSCADNDPYLGCNNSGGVSYHVMKVSTDNNCP